MGISDEGSHLTVQDFAQILRSRWKIICATTVIAILGALAYSLLVTPLYQASTRLFVSTTSEGTNTEANDGGLFAQRRVLSYTELLTGEILAQRTIDKLGLDMSVEQLQEEIEASAPTDTVLIDVTVTDASPDRARNIANTLSDEFVVMAAGLETPELGARPNAQVVVLQRANIPDRPVSPHTARTLAIAAVLGVLVGILAAVLRDRLDSTVRSRGALEKVTGVGVLAEIPSEPQRRDIPLISFPDHAASADAFRALRINLQFLEVGDGSRVLLVASASPVEGRTTVALNLAAALAEAGHTVVVVDGDLRYPGVAGYLGIDSPVGFSTVLAGDATVREALRETRFARVSVLPSGPVPPNPGELLGSRATEEVLSELGGQFDYVIVDSPPLLVTDAAILARSCQAVLMVARFGKTKRRQLKPAIDGLRRAGAPLFGAVMTMTPAKKQRSIDGRYYGAASSRVRGSHQK
ncbi:polysaccharide biosynthesis tyrosine autokinase [soil metagenome]